MASTSPSPDSSPPPVPPPPPNSSTSVPPPQSSPPPSSSSPPPQSPPPEVSPPPAPPSPPATPPPEASPPPAPPLPASPPATPPQASIPPPSPPPFNATPPAPILSPPPPSGVPPPQPSRTPPRPPAVTPSPPPAAAPPPPPQRANSPENSPPSQQLTPPPVPTSISPPASTSSPPTNSSSSGTPTTSQLPPFLAEQPTPISTNPVSNGGSSGGSRTGGAIAIGLVVGFLAIGLLVMAVWYRRRQKKRIGPNLASPSSSSQNSDSFFLRTQQIANHIARKPLGSKFMYSQEQGGDVGTSKAWFTYEELSNATNGFAESNLLGEGGFGCVYKGLLEDGREVAVKQLKIGGEQGEREFRAEVDIISRVHHRHLVSLVGYCISEHHRLLVYQYVPNDTLYYHLHGKGRPVLEWATRIRVAAGAARGLAYLHEDCHPRIIHRDIKSSNILLDNNFDAQVADFGLAKLAMDANTHVTTRVMGTFGYMAPEYASSGKLTEKSDVYSFGVVLLELITGRKPVDTSQPLGDESLVEWARPLLIRALDKEDFEELVDPMLENNYVRVEMFRMIECAAACIRHLAPMRPRMSQVVRAMDSIVEFTTDLTNGMKPGESKIIDSREQSAEIRLFQRMAFGSQDYSSEFFNNSKSS